MYTKASFSTEDLWKIYDALTNVDSGTATASNQSQAINILADILDSVTDGNGDPALLDPDNDYTSYLASLPGVLTALKSLQKGNTINGQSNLKSVFSDTYDNELDAYTDAAEKWADVVSDNVGKCYTDFQINYIVYPAASLGKTNIVCRMSAMFNDTTI